MGGDFDYDRHGTGYAEQRRPDPRIARFIHTALGAARTVLNVGAGAGSYEPTDRQIIAVEPSAAMRRQRSVHLAPAIHAFAEHLPLRDRSVDASMALATVHQWSDLPRGIRELRRVTRGPVLVMTFDPDALDRWWFAQYAPDLLAAEQRRLPPIELIRSYLGEMTAVETVPIPLDCTDGFIEAFYGRPERLLDPAVRAAQSAWRFVPPHVQERFVAELGHDLDSGVWDRKYGALRHCPKFVGSLRLVIGLPEGSHGAN